MLQQSRFSPNYTPPIHLISDNDDSGRSAIEWTEHSRVASTFLEQAPRLYLVRGKRVSPDALLSACLGLRRLHIYPMSPMPKVTVESARCLSGIRCLMLYRSAAIEVETVDTLLSRMPRLRELHILLLDGEADPISADHIITGRPGNALERYRMHSVLACSIVPLFYCSDTLRHLDITLRGHDDPAARTALINRLGSAPFRRLKSLRLDTRDLQIPEDIAPRLVAACRFVRALELRVCKIEAYDLVDVILRVCPHGVHRLVIVSSSENEREREHIKTLTRIVDPTTHAGMPALRELELRTFVRLADVGLAELRDACIKRRIIFRLQ